MKIIIWIFRLMYSIFKWFLIVLIFTSCVRKNTVAFQKEGPRTHFSIQENQGLLITAPLEVQFGHDIQVFFRCKGSTNQIKTNISKDRVFPIQNETYILVEEPSNCLIESFKIVVDSQEFDWTPIPLDEK